MNLVAPPYSTIEYSNPVVISDHLNGFDEHGYNLVLDTLNKEAERRGEQCEVVYHQWLPEWIQDRYSYLDLIFDANFQRSMNFVFFEKQDTVVKNKPENFIFTALGSPHDGRKLLFGTLLLRGWFDFNYSRKNMACTLDEIDNLVVHHSKNSQRSEQVNHRLFVPDCYSDLLCEAQHGLVDHSVPTFDRLWNIEDQITKSFVHIVSETMSTSSVPFITEKFLYSVYSEGLFLANAQPLWHHTLEKIYGFKLYRNVFDYDFDNVTNPLDRITKMCGMLSKYQHLTSDQWQELIDSERDTIEFNKQHLISKDYLKCATQYDTWQNGKLSGRARKQDLLQFQQLVKGKVYG